MKKVFKLTYTDAYLTMSEWLIMAFVAIIAIVIVVVIVRARKRGAQIIGGRGSASSFWWFVGNPSSGADFEGGGSSGSW